MNRIPAPGWILTGALLLLLHQTIGTAAAMQVAVDVIRWTATTPAALALIAITAAHHLITRHPHHADV